MRWVSAYVGIGSNLDDPTAQVRTAGEELAGIRATRLEAMSCLYRNPPMGSADQPDYVNAVAGLLTRLEPSELLRELLRLEQGRGRVRDPDSHWGARCIGLRTASRRGTWPLRFRQNNSFEMHNH